MAAKPRLRRPSKAMMLAVNAAIDRRDKEVAKLIDEHDLDPAELEQRLLLRDGRRYEPNGTRRRGGRKTRARVEGGAGNAKVKAGVLNVTIDGRTSVAKLYRIIDEAEQLKSQAQRELKRRPADQIESAKKTLAEIELLRKEREKLERRIGELQDALS